MTLQYEQPSINLERVTALKTFFFDSNSTTNSDILFNNWESMLSLLHTIPGIKEVIIQGLPSVIPPGTWDMTNIILTGEPDGSSSVFIDDAVFQNLSKISNINIGVGGVGGANTVPSFQINNASVESIVLDKVQMTVGPNATAPMFRIVAGSYIILPTFSSFISVNPAVPVFDVQNVSNLAFGSIGGTGGQNSYGGNLGNESIFTIAGGATVAIQRNATDLLFVQDQTNAPTVSFLQNYEAADVADWSGTEPESIQNALDRIAAAVGPIA